MIGIFFLRPTLGGGTTTFTAHLYHALKQAGAMPTLYRVGEHASERPHRFGKYDINYQRVTFAQAAKIVRMMPTVLACPTNPKFTPFEPAIIPKLMKLGMRVVIHDHTELMLYRSINWRKVHPPICIRPTLKEFLTQAVWIPHPYKRQTALEHAHKKLAVSTARISADKRPRLLIKANRLLPKSRRIDLKGAEFRLYTYGLQKQFSDVFQQSGGTLQFPMNMSAPVEMVGRYKYNFDMSYFNHDGGGTQYVQLEAMDAGTVNVMHSDWFRFNGELKAGIHALTVTSPEDIAALLRLPDSPGIIDDINANCQHLLNRHAPKLIGAMYIQELDR